MKFKFLITGLLVAGLVLLISKGVWAAGASLSLSPATKTMAAGASMNVEVILDTGGQAVSSVSAVINYDPLLVSPVIIPGTGLVLTKSTVASGVITLGTGTLSPNFSGTTTLATISLKALKSGTASMTIVFTGASSGSSTVTGSNGVTNILSLVNSGTYTITMVTPPQTGAVENTILMLMGGLFLLGIGSWRWLWNLRK